MSNCGIVEFRAGLASRTVYFKNAWGGHMLIWTELFDKYMRDADRPYDSVLGLIGGLTDTEADRSRVEKLWNLPQHQPGMLQCEVVCHLATMDGAVVMSRDFGRLQADLLEFAERFSLRGVENLRAWAAHLAGLPPDVCAIAFHGTTITRNPWFVVPSTVGDRDCDDEGEHAGYSLESGNTHFDVYAELLSFFPAEVVSDVRAAIESNDEQVGVQNANSGG